MVLFKRKMYAQKIANEMKRRSKIESFFNPNITRNPREIEAKYTEIELENVIEKVIFKHDRTIVILIDGRKGVAQCSKKDKFNEQVGMLIALGRALSS